MKQVLWFLAVLGLTASVASAGPNSGGVLWVHDTGIEFSSDLALPPVSTPPADCAGVDSQAVVNDVPRIWKVYAAFPPGSSPRLMTVGLGTQFTTAATSYVVVVGGDFANPGDFSLPLDGFPTADGGKVGLVFTAGVRRTTLEEIFYFWGYGFNTSGPLPTWSLVPKVGDDNFGDDQIPANTDPIMGYGSLGFGTPGTSPCPVPDPNTLAACCTPAGVCTVTTQADCPTTSAWHANWYVCDPNPCVQGACCWRDGACEITTELLCFDGHGRYQGDSAPCSPDPCPPLGSCCYPDGSCQVHLHADCTGDWTLSGTCEPYNICPAPEELRACCTLQAICTMTMRADCAQPSQWHAEWLVCDPNPCSTPLGACCTLNFACTMTTEVNCEPSSTWYFDLTSCEPNQCRAMPTESTSWGRVKNRYR